MKPRRILATARLAFPLAAISLTLTAPFAFAANLTWDAGNTGNGATIDPASGDWNTTGGNIVWNNAGTNVIWSQTATNDGSNAAIFAGTDGTLNQYVVTIGATNMAAESVTFNSSGYQITGGTLAIIPNPASGDNGPITVAAGKTATINSAIAYRNNTGTIIDVGSGGVLNLGGGMSNSQYNFTGAGTVNMTNGTYQANTGQVNVASFNQTGGAFGLNQGNTVSYTIGNNAGQNVAYTISGGSLTSNANSGTHTDARLNIGFTTGTNTATLTVKTGATVSVGTTAAGQLRIGGNADSNGVLDVQGGTLTVGTNKPLNSLYFFVDGANANRSAVMTQSGGTVTTGGIQFGGSSGTYDALSSASLTLSGGNLYVGTAGITRGSAAGALPTTIRLQGGTLGADQNWSSSLDMKLGTTGGGPTIRAQNSGTTARNITLSGILSNDGAVNGTLTKTGNGNLTLSNANTFTGATTISAGKILMTNASALQNSSYNTTGSTGAIGLDVTGGLSSGTLTLGGLAGGVNVATAITGYGSVTGLVLNPQTGTTPSYSGILANGSGAMTLTKTGDGTQTLTGSNTYSGLTAVNGGTLIISNNAIQKTRSYSVASGATLEVNNTTGSFKDMDGVTLTGAGTFKKTGANEVRVTSGNSTIAMGSNGLFHVADGNFYFGGATGGNWTGNLGDMQIDATGSFDARQTGIVIDALLGSGTLAIGTKSTGNAYSTTALTLGVDNGTGTFSGSIVDVTSTGGNTDFSVVKSGSGTQTLSGMNSYTGNTTVSAGTLELGHNSAAGVGGDILLTGATSILKSASGITVANDITLSNAAAKVDRVLAASDAFSTGTNGNLTSSFASANPDTTAQILDGSSMAGGLFSMSFSDTSAASNDGIRRSDVFTTTGTGTDEFVVQLLVSGGLAADSRLAWLNGSNVWVDAGSNFFANTAWTASTYTAGDFGFDNVTNSVWGVVQYGNISSFAAVPEPTSALAGILLTAGLLRRRRNVEG